MAIDLTKPETELLQAVLEKELEEVRSEQHHTQAHEYKESLRERETLVRGLLARLRA